MIVFSEGLRVSPPWAHSFVILLMLSNLWLYWLPEETLGRTSFYSTVAVVDIVLVTAALVISGQTGTDFYLMYFLVIIISAFSQDLNRIMISTVLVTLIYGLTLLLTSYERAASDPTVLLRFPFFFIIALFYGYVVQSVIEEKLGREKLAQEEVNRLKAQFLGNLTSQLLRPINAMLGNVHLLLTGASGDLSLDQIKLVDQLQLHAERIVSLIRDLVDLSKIEAVRSTLHVQKGPVKPFLEQIDREIQPWLKEKRLSTEILCGDDLPLIETDWGKLRQALLYILSHAIKLAPSGRLAVIACRWPDEERLSFAIMEAEAQIGKEAMPATLERITRTDSSGHHEASDSGVGIEVAKNLIAVLGGSIAIRSRSASSPEVAITIPILWGQKPKEVVEINYTEPLIQRPS